MSTPLIISHRGANKYAPQNTIPAFEGALEIGIDGFETDVHITKDGHVVICHNYTIDETSDGKGKISDMTLEELKSHDFGSYFSKNFEGTTLPTLDEFLTLAETADIKVINIEIKPPKQKETAIVRETIKAVKAHGLFDKLLISSFSPDILREAKRIDKNCRTGFLYGPNSPTTPFVAWRIFSYVKSLGCEAVHPNFIFVNKSYIEKAHEAGLKVNPWTVDLPDLIDNMIKWGADAIITNLPDVVGKMKKRYE